MVRKHFPVKLQLELMGVIWGILSVLLTITYFSAEYLKFSYTWPFKYGGMITFLIALIYFIGSIIRLKK